MEHLLVRAPQFGGRVRALPSQQVTMPIQILVTCKIQGNYYKKQQKVKVEPTDLVDTLYEKLAALFGMPGDKLIIKYYRDGHLLRLVEGWKLEHYLLQENSVVVVETQEDQTDNVAVVAEDAMIGIDRKIRELYRMRIAGQLDGDESQVQQDLSILDVSSETSPEDNAGRPIIYKLVQESHARRTFTKVVPAGEKLLKDLCHVIRTGQNAFTLFTKKHKLPDSIWNTSDRDGWYPIHHALSYNNKTAIEYICGISNDLNQTTKDGYTVLMLCAYKKSLSIFKFLLQTDKIVLNIVTSKGTIVHFLVDENQPKFLQLLSEERIDLSVKDFRGRTVAQMITDPMLLRKFQLKVIEDRKLARLEDVPPRAEGTLMKETSVFKYMGERYLVLDPANGLLLRYKCKAEAPNKPKGILRLNDITSVEVLGEKKSMLSKHQYFFSITHKDGQDIYAALSEQSRSAWVSRISLAHEYWKLVLSVPDWFLNLQAISEQKRTVDMDLHLQSEKKVVPQTNKTLDHTNTLTSVIATNKTAKLTDFEVIKLLGEGSFGVVFQVKHRQTGSVFAMKVLTKKTLYLRKMKRYAVTEASILKKANHPLVLRMYFSFQTPTSLYMVCDCCSDKNLEMLLSERDTLTEDEVLFYMAEITAGLEYLHSCGVLYRDLKPENVMIGLDGHVVLVDFGLSKEGVAKGEYAKSKVGSPLYFAPEIVKGKGATQVSDIFALGILFYRLLFKEDPYDGTTDIFVLNDKILNEEIEPMYHIKPAAEDLLKLLTKKDPTCRLGYNSFSEIKCHPYFSKVDWDKVSTKGLEVPKPKVKKTRRYGSSNNEDFDSQMLDDLDYTEANYNFLRVSDWSFTRNTSNLT